MKSLKDYSHVNLCHFFLFLLVSEVGCDFCLWLFLVFSVYLFLGWSGPAALWGFRHFKNCSMPSTDMCISGVLGKGFDSKGRFIPESCKSCKVL